MTGAPFVILFVLIGTFVPIYFTLFIIEFILIKIFLNRKLDLGKLWIALFISLLAVGYFIYKLALFEGPLDKLGGLSIGARYLVYLYLFINPKSKGVQKHAFIPLSLNPRFAQLLQVFSAE